MRVTLRRPDRHRGERGDLLERQVEAVLQHDDLRLGRRDLCQLSPQLAPKVGTRGGSRRIAVRSDAGILDERLATTDTLTVSDVAARIDDEPMQPRRKRRIAAKLPDAHANLGERLLGGVAGILAVCEQVRGEALDRGSVPLAQGGEGAPVAVFGSFDEDRITQALVDERPRGPRVLLDLTALAEGRLHGKN